MNRKSLLTITMFAMIVITLFLSSCSSNVQQSESSQIQQESEQVTPDTQIQTEETQENANDGAIVEEVDDLLLDENEVVEIGEII